MTVTNRELAQDLSTKGCFPKAWIRDKNGFRLLKDGDEEAVERELLQVRSVSASAYVRWSTGKLF